MTDSGSREALAEFVAGRIRDVPDFPVPGVLFRDLGPLLADPRGLRELADDIVRRFAGRVDAVAGIEARGFILGAPAAMALGVGFVPIRKAGKLPGEIVAASYELEYGSATLEMRADAVDAGAAVLLVDDVLATGGTTLAACGLLEGCGARVAAVDILLEIVDLGGRGRLGDRRVDVLLRA